MADAYTEHMTRLPSEVKRLDDQFDIMTRNVGYIVHPSITLPPSPRIADLGTGTARFLRSIHPSYPGAILEGFDISPTLFPPKDVLPENISLSVLDIKKPLPEEMHGQYDLVHVRMLVAAMLPEDWEPTVRNVTQLLKPGGYLQWEECDFASAYWLRSSETSRIEKMTLIMGEFQKALYSRFEKGWSTLPHDMKAAGLDSITSDVASSDAVPETREGITSAMSVLVFTWARMMTGRGVSGPVFNDKLDDLEKEVAEEIKSGGYFKFNIHVAFGRKPQE